MEEARSKDEVGIEIARTHMGDESQWKLNLTQKSFKGGIPRSDAAPGDK